MSGFVSSPRPEGPPVVFRPRSPGGPGACAVRSVDSARRTWRTASGTRARVDVGSITTSVDPVARRPPPDDPRSGGPHGRWRRKRSWLVAAAVLSLLWLLAAALQLGAAATALREAAAAMPAAREAVASQQLEASRDAVGTLRTEARTAAGHLRSPFVAPFRLLPVVGADLRVATDLAVASADLGDAVEVVLTTLDKLPGGLAALAPRGGRLPVDALEQLAPPLRLAAAATAAAAERVGAGAPSGRIAPVSDAHSTALDLLEPLAGQLDLTARLAGELPWLLGADGPRTYLFAASTPAALGGTGGFLGSISLLTIDEGRLTFGDFEATNQLENLPRGALPPSGRGGCRPLGPLRRHGRLAHAQPLAPLPRRRERDAALWEATPGGPTRRDDRRRPLRARGAARARRSPGGPRPRHIDADEVVAYVSNEAYDDFDDPNEERKEVLGAVAAAAFNGFLESAEEPGPTWSPASVTSSIGRAPARARDRRPASRDPRRRRRGRGARRRPQRPPERRAQQRHGQQGRLLRRAADHAQGEPARRRLCPQRARAVGSATRRRPPGALEVRDRPQQPAAGTPATTWSTSASTPARAPTSIRSRPPAPTCRASPRPNSGTR
jgi:hypothetical protein